MADVEAKLRWLSERGNPVGAEELIERLEADLAGNPLVVVADRRAETLVTKTQDRPMTQRPSRSRGFAWAVAVVAAVVAVAGLNLVLTTNRDQVADNPSVPTLATPDGGTMADLEIIDAGVEALFSGDADRAVELFELPAPQDDAWIRTEAQYQATIGGRLTPECTELADPDVFSCFVPYHNAFTDAIGWVNSPGDEVRVSVVDGVITQFGFSVHSFVERGWAEFLAATGSGYPDCGFEHSIECAVLLMSELDAWAAWAETNLKTTWTDLEIIERGVATLYFGDVDRAVELFELDSPLCCDGLSGDEWIRETAAYQAAVGGGLVTLDCVEQGAPGLFDCTVPYQNVFTNVIGWVDSPGETIRVAVENGVITEFDPYPVFIHEALKDFLQEQAALQEQGVVDLGDSRCSFSNGLNRLGWLTEDCINFVLAHLDAWAAWAETNLGRSPVAMSAVIEAGVEALYSGEADRAAELFELPDRDDDEIRRLAAYEAAIDGRLVLSCWEPRFGQFDCFANYQNALTDAIGSGPPGDAFSAVVEAGVITEFYFPEHTYLVASVANYLNQVQDDSACGREFFPIFRAEGGTPPTAGCVAVIMANLDDWAAWYRTNG